MSRLVEIRSLVSADRAKWLMELILKGGASPLVDRLPPAAEPKPDAAPAPITPPAVVILPPAPVATSPAPKPALSREAQERLDRMLFDSVKCQDHTAMQEVLASGANPNAKDYSKVTPVGRQAYFYEVNDNFARTIQAGMKILLDAGASPNCLTEYGHSIIGEWVSHGLDPAFFKDYQTDYDMRDKRGNNVFVYLYDYLIVLAQKSKPLPDIQSRLFQLKQLGATPNGTVLHHIVSNDEREKVSTYSHGSTFWTQRPESVCVQIRSVVDQFIDSFFAIGGSPDIQDSEGMTALMRALDKKDWRVADAILRNPNIDFTVRTKQGESVLMRMVDYQRNSGHRDDEFDRENTARIIKELRHRGASM